MLASGASELQGIVDFTVKLGSRLASSSSLCQDWLPVVFTRFPQLGTGDYGPAGVVEQSPGNAAGQQQVVETTLWLSGIAPIIETVGLWTQYSNHKGDVSAMQSDMELATAIAATIVAVVIFLLFLQFCSVAPCLR